MIEEWKVFSITDHPRWGHNIYEVSNFGNVRKNGELIDYEHGSRNQTYYGIANQCSVHRAVAELFIGSIPKGMDVDHIDGNTHNNNVNNLRICTRKENNSNPIRCERIRKARTGKSNGPFSQKARKNMSLSHTGKSSGMKGKHHSCETKQHIRNNSISGLHRIYNDDGSYHFK